MKTWAILLGLALNFCCMFSLSADVKGTHTPSSCELVDRLLSKEIIFPGLNRFQDFYASTVIVDPMSGDLLTWFGGWRNLSDFPMDKLFLGISKDGKTWEGPSDPVVKIRGAMNDPAVVYQKSKQRYLMFFSYQKDPAKGHLLPGNGHLDGDESYMHVWVAESTDARNWVNPRRILGRENGFDRTGAWAASAILEDENTLSLYFHNNPNFNVHPEDKFLILRSRVDISSNELAVLETKPVKVYQATNHVMGNVNVVRVKEKLYMTYNEMIPGPKPLGLRFRAAAATSTDQGDTWTEISSELFRPPGSEDLDIAKPTLFFPPNHPDEVWLFVGEGNQGNLQSSISLWKYSACAN